MSTIPASQIVDDTPSVLAVGGAAIDLNGVFLTTSIRVPIGTFASFGSQAAVASFFGATSAEAIVAGVYFSGPDGSSKKPGTVLFAQYPTASVAAYVRGGNISNISLATLQSYSGTLNVTIDGVLKTASVNLSGATSFANAAEIIAADLGIEGVTAGTVTGSIGGTGTTCTTSGTTLTMGALATGKFQVGDTLTANDGTHSLSTQTILAQLTGTPGGSAGATFQMSGAATGGDLTSTTVTAKGTTMTVTALGTATAVEVADVVSGAGVTANTYVASQITPLITGEATGGVGRYVISVSPAAVVVSETLTLFTPAVQYDPTSGAFIIFSGTAGAASTITYGSGAMATSLLLTQAAGAVLSQGAVAGVPASFMNALIVQTTNWALFTTLFNPDNSGFANKLAFAAWVSGQNNRYGYVAWDTDTSPKLAVPATASFGYALAQAGYSGTILDWEPSDLNHAAFILGWAASIDTTRTNGRATLAFRSQAGLTPAVTDGQTAINLGGNPQVVGDRGNGYNFYGTYGSGNAGFTFMNRGFISGPFLWADSYVNQIWLNNAMQVALLNYRTSVESVAFNAAGYGAIAQVLKDPIDAGLNFGAIVPGVTLSASQIASVNAATGVDAATPIQQRGWFLQVVPASPTVRASRGPLAVNFFYADGQSIQSVALSSVAVL